MALLPIYDPADSVAANNARSFNLRCGDRVVGTKVAAVVWIIQRGPVIDELEETLRVLGDVIIRVNWVGRVH